MAGAGGRCIVIETVLLSIILLGVAVLLVIAALRSRKAGSDPALLKSLADMENRLREELARVRAGFDSALRETAQSSRKSQDERLDRMDVSLKEFTAAFNRALGETKSILQQMSKEQIEQNSASFNSLQTMVRERLEEVRRDNEEKLEKIRATVDEKLHVALEERLGQSFKLVSERLELVHKGLGEMQTLASGVGDLKKVLTNVRARGTFGEIQLEALLEQVLTPSQYDKNVATVPGSTERVEFAIRLPGRDMDSSIVYLPIDAKYPQEDYIRLQEANEAGDALGLEASRKSLRARLLLEADTIRTKYIAPPGTTDFALMFLPTEGLYAEIQRMTGLAEELQKRRIVPVGPNNLYALLNSLQMGFRTLAIEKRSSEVWKILGAVKTEFARFGESLDAVSKKLLEASNKIEDSAKRSRAVERRLREVEALPADDAVKLLPDTEEN